MKKNRDLEKARRKFQRYCAKLVLDFGMVPVGVIYRNYIDGTRVELGNIELMEATQVEKDLAKDLLDYKKVNPVLESKPRGLSSLKIETD